jgi:hypothetical protein
VRLAFAEGMEINSGLYVAWDSHRMAVASLRNGWGATQCQNMVESARLLGAS